MLHSADPMTPEAASVAAPSRGCRTPSKAQADCPGRAALFLRPTAGSPGHQPLGGGALSRRPRANFDPKAPFEFPQS